MINNDVGIKKGFKTANNIIGESGVQTCPKELIPTEIKLRPMDNTTVPVTTAGKNLRNGFKKNPSTPSNKPPIIDAPIMAPYARTPPPIVASGFWFLY